VRELADEEDIQDFFNEEDLKSVAGDDMSNRGSFLQPHADVVLAKKKQPTNKPT
jgi:hypothetical protein